MSGNDPIAACDRLVRIFERAQNLQLAGRPEAEDTIQTPLVPFAVALLSMRVRPALTPGWLDKDPVHAVLMGATNTGKSTLLNVLLGRDAAGMGVRARLSQHPEAYRPVSLGDEWLNTFDSRFRAYRRFYNEHPPRQEDDDLRRNGYIPALAVIDPARIAADELAPVFSQSAIVWDGPDFSTEAAQSYLSAVIDLIGLADLVVMTTTDEAYADDRGNLLLRMLADAGIPVVVVANKVPENSSLIDNIAQTIKDQGHQKAPPLQLREVRGTSPAERLKSLLGMSQTNSVRDTIGREVARGRELKRQALRNSVQFIGKRLEGMLQPLIEEAGAAAEWSKVVEKVTTERVLEPYRRDYLEGVNYAEFNRTLVHLVELLRVPVVGVVVETAGHVVRVPLKLVKHGFRKLMKLPTSSATTIPEEEVLRSAIGSLLLRLTSEAQARAGKGSHGSWGLVAQKLGEPIFSKRLYDIFQRDFLEYRQAFEQEVRRRAENLYNKLKEDPARLQTLRGANLLAGTASVAVAVKTAGLSWSDAVLGPVVAGLWHNLLEWGLGRYLETLRTDLVADQYRAVEDLVSKSLADPLKKLFDVAVSAKELEVALADFTLVKTEALRVAGGRDA
ncbi:hypothetical protein [Singulisphaera sp. PoT]|uniref:hypothetical protein n=1 Tax=Singulisphaera sp. PoT TaxID=3411797 RepID=UPI003BF58A9D